MALSVLRSYLFYSVFTFIQNFSSKYVKKHETSFSLHISKKRDNVLQDFFPPDFPYIFHCFHASSVFFRMIRVILGGMVFTSIRWFIDSF